MNTYIMKENRVSIQRNHLISLGQEPNSIKLDQLKRSFCGTIHPSIDGLRTARISSGSNIYFYGNLSNLESLKTLGTIPNSNLCLYDENEKTVKIDLTRAECVFVIEEFSSGVQKDSQEYTVINSDQVPINVHGVGVFFKQLFGSDRQWFEEVEKAHEFQELTESNKPGKALRKGLYMTEVSEKEDGTHFNLLRCSTNFATPTENYRSVDHDIVNTVNRFAQTCFETNTRLNHTLAQIYENCIGIDHDENKQRKAKIKEHSDKTKDMPLNGLIAFTTFYRGYTEEGFTHHDKVKRSKEDPHNHLYAKETVLTSLKFRLKQEAKQLPENQSLPTQFNVLLYPNSVFVIPLLMNRLYTHEIVPSTLSIDKIPIRMGYVIRCSNTSAVHRDGNTYMIMKTGKEVKLVEPTKEGVKELKEKYRKENLTIELVDYDGVDFSLNRGDYLRPVA